MVEAVSVTVYWELGKCGAKMKKINCIYCGKEFEYDDSTRYYPVMRGDSKSRLHLIQYFCSLCCSIQCKESMVEAFMEVRI